MTLAMLQAILPLPRAENGSGRKSFVQMWEYVCTVPREKPLIEELFLAPAKSGICVKPLGVWG
jgi:hypothetical protein